MPKERRARSTSSDARSPAPYCSCGHRRAPLSSFSSFKNPPKPPGVSFEDMKEWDEVRCPVCMEHPHNAVLLICSSFDKGCRPFMCDTSYRHSNCLDQYRKAFSGSSPVEENVGNQDHTELSCPLCRGGVTGWKVVGAAREYMNSKSRNCSKESCVFAGYYEELRKHARKEHPTVRPSEADPEREQGWRTMEQERDLGDLFSTMQSALGGVDGGLASFVEDDEVVVTGTNSRISSMEVTIYFSFAPSGVNWIPIGSQTGEPQPDDMVNADEGDDEWSDDEEDSVDGDSNSVGTTMATIEPVRRGLRRRLRRAIDDLTDNETGL